MTAVRITITRQLGTRIKSTRTHILATLSLYNVRNHVFWQESFIGFFLGAWTRETSRWLIQFSILRNGFALD